MKNTSKSTLFKYQCSCGNVNFFKINNGIAFCEQCDTKYQVSPNGVIIFHQEKTEQNAYFDNLYQAGHSHTKDKFQEDYTSAFDNSVERAITYLNSLDIDSTKLSNLSILDVACGSGWVTAGLLQNKNIHNCKLHAFDISPDGPEMLARFDKNIKSSNLLELSVQDAEAMKFSEATFDVIIGNSILHHFDNFEGFLADCHRILKNGGMAVFGEPFSLGYGIGAAALFVAQKQLDTHYDIIDSFYNDLVLRNKKSPEVLKSLIDKHLFFQSLFIPLAQKIGFSSVDFILPGSREYYKNNFIDDLLKERGIIDAVLSERANSIYRAYFDIFDTDSFAHSMGAFVHIVLKKNPIDIDLNHKIK